MPQAVLATDPVNIIIVQAGRAYHRRPNKPDVEIGAFSDRFRQAAISKWGMIEISDAPEIGNGFPLLQFAAGKYTTASIVAEHMLQAENALNEKAYNPAQPRVPAGSPQGGQFASSHTVSAAAAGLVAPAAATATTPPPAADAWEKEKPAFEAWRKQRDAAEARVMAKIDSALEQKDPVIREPLDADLKAKYRKAFEDTLPYLNDHSLSLLEENVDGAVFYMNSKSLTLKIAGPNALREGKGEVLGAWSHNINDGKGTLHLDGGDRANNSLLNDYSQQAMRHVYSHEVAHAVDWVRPSVTKEKVYKLAVSEAEATDKILERIDKMPWSERRRQSEMENAGHSIHNREYWSTMGLDVDDLYQASGEREIHVRGHQISDTVPWARAFKSEIAPDSGAAPLSKYATTSASEGFAEFGRLVYTNPKEARQLFPKCWSVWQEFGLVDAPKSKPWNK